jgi:hypothetical protein
MLRNISFLKKLFCSGFSAVLFVLIIPTFVSAYSYAGVKWPSNGTTVDFGSPSIPGSWITPIAQGVAPWNGATSPFTFSAGTSNNDITVSNFGAGALALTTVTSSGSTITDSDLVFNSYYSWSTSGAPGLYDVQNVATHEFGHFLMLNDLYGGGDTEKTMYGYVGTGETKKRTLDTDDLNGINAVYP